MKRQFLFAERNFTTRNAIQKKFKWRKRKVFIQNAVHCETLNTYFTFDVCLQSQNARRAKRKNEAEGQRSWGRHSVIPSGQRRTESRESSLKHDQAEAKGEGGKCWWNWTIPNNEDWSFYWWLTVMIPGKVGCSFTESQSSKRSRSFQSCKNRKNET